MFRRYLRPFICVLTALTLLVSGIPSLVVARPDGQNSTVNVEFIIDQSGSMGAETDSGVLRMISAQSVFKEVVQQIPDNGNVNVGLRVYGHLGNNQPDGQAQSCQSTELLVPVDGVDHQLLESTVDGLYPVGWTPIGLALQEAGNDFPVPGPNDQNLIILITDGLETCGMDPALEAGNLKNSDKAITTHVIGFGTSPDEQSILNSISGASGGELIGSQNAAQLISAIFSILEESEVVTVSGDGLTRESPLAIGRTGKIGDYDLTVISVQQNANESVMSHNQFNQPPAPDEQFFMARVSATYQGTETGLPMVDLQYKAVGAENTGYTDYQNTCGDIPDSSYTISDVFPGGTVEFNICWKIKSADADSLVMYVEPLLSFNDPPLWFAIGNPILTPVEATPEPEGTAQASSNENPEPVERTPRQTDASESSGETTGSSEANAVPLGTMGVVGDYEVTVISTTPNAYDLVMAENPYNEVPAPDEQFYIARVKVTYIGSGSGMPSVDLMPSALGANRTAYTTFQNFCGVIPDDPMMIAELFSGGGAEMNFCWKIKTGDSESLVMYIDEDFGMGDRVWFSLTP